MPVRVVLQPNDPRPPFSLETTLSFNLIEKGIIMNITDDEALGFMDRLLEWLRQADLTNFGSHIEVVYVATS